MSFMGREAHNHQSVTATSRSRAAKPGQDKYTAGLTTGLVMLNGRDSARRVLRMEIAV